MALTFKRGDTYPNLKIALTQSGAAISLAAASYVTIIMKSGSTTLELGPATITDAAGGLIEYAWQVGDTAIVGTYQLECEIHWAAGGIQTVPNATYDSVVIMQDLGGS